MERLEETIVDPDWEKTEDLPTLDMAAGGLARAIGVRRPNVGSVMDEIASEDAGPAGREGGSRGFDNRTNMRRSTDS